MPPPEPRPYSSPKRDAAAAEKRQQVLDTAARLLDDGSSLMSMEAVAKAAGVTRLTVYKQFGSRRGLLEAVFDENARRGGIFRMADAMQNPDGRAGLLYAIDIMCEFWGSHPGFARLHDAAATDPEFADAIDARNERRRMVIHACLAKLPEHDAIRHDTADILFGLTGMAMFRVLSPGRTPAEIATVMKRAVAAVLDGPKAT